MRKIKNQNQIGKENLWVGIQYSFFNLYFLEINFSFMSQKITLSSNIYPLFRLFL